MRISLLRQREPICEILEKTLAQYFSAEYGQKHEVAWTKSGTDENRLIVNEYLNAIFHRTIPSEALEPIRKEYSRSTTAWKRPLQSAYVRWATRPPTSNWFAHASLAVTPFIPALRTQLIVPGNQKVRILDHENQTCTSILKDGFRDDAMRAECNAREQAAKLGIHVPETRSVDIERGVLCESYVSATPLNRLPDAAHAEQSRLSAFQAIQRLVEATRREESLTDYVTAVGESVCNRLSRYSKQNPETVHRTEKLVHFLQSQAIKSDSADRIHVSMTHGDFQPANILSNTDGTWIIDWENSLERQSGYDWLVFELEPRRSSITERLLKFVSSDNCTAPSWTALRLATRGQRIQHLAIFLLEELAAKANEVSQPAIPELAADFRSLVDQVDEWQTKTES